MIGQDYSRRNVLRAGTTAAGTVVLGSLAGCEGVEQFAGDDDADTPEATETEDGDDEPAGPYREWLPGPDAFEDTDHYFFRYVDYEQLRANESNFDPEVYDQYTQDVAIFSDFDITPEDVEWVVFVPPILSDTPAVVSGSFSADDIADSLTDDGYEEDGEIGEYTVYNNPSRARFGVTDGTFVLTGDNDSDDVRTLIETNNGEVSRYQDESDDMATLLDRLGTGTFVGGTTNDAYTEDETDPAAFQFAGQVGFAFTDMVSGETTSTELFMLFETAEDVDMDAVSESTESDTLANYNDVSSTQEGRIAIITGTVPTEELYAN